MPPGSDGLGVDPLEGVLAGRNQNDAPSPVVTAFSIIKLLSGVQGTLPRSVHERDDLARRPVRSSETDFLWSRPNSDWRTSPKSWWVSVFAHLEGWGNVYIWMRRVGSTVIGIEFIHPSRVTAKLNATGQKVFEIRQYGNAPPVTATSDELLHVFGVSFDGVSGVKPVRAGLASHEQAQLLDRWGRNFLRNGGRYSGMVSTDQHLTDDDYDEWGDAWEKQNSGPSAVGKTILMDRGATYHQFTIPPEEAQYIESRQYTREEVLGVYAPGLPHHLVGWRSNTSNFGTGLEAQGRHLAAFVLMQRLDLIADAIGLELLPPELELEFRLDRLLKADPKVMADVYLKMRNGGAASREDWRAAVGLPPIEGVPDDLTYQKNMTVVDLGGDVQFAEAEAAADEEPFGLPAAAVLVEGRCTNDACDSRREGRAGRLLARRVGQAEILCPTCGVVTEFGGSRTLRDSRDLSDAIVDQLSARFALAPSA